VSKSQPSGKKPPDQRPGVGVGVIVTRGREVLLIKRLHHGAGQWAAPGGYLDRGESFEDCAVRETLEETGVTIADATVRAVANDRHPDGKHNVTIWLSARFAAGDARVGSPDEVGDVGWFRWDALPEPLYLSTRNFLAGRTYPPNAHLAVLAGDERPGAASDTPG
jgi:8-oxo-dGTP diphosphatase